MKCESCNSEHDGSYGSGRFCNKKCAHSYCTKYKRSEINIKVSNKLKGTITQKNYNILDCNHYIKCKMCGIEFLHPKWNKNRKYCTIACYFKDKDVMKLNGGVKLNGGRSKCGWYKDIYCGSSYELAWVMYNLDNGISFERNTEGFDYEFDGVRHKYYPDFKIGDEYIEIKGFKREDDDAKWEQFPHKLKILLKTDMKPIIAYASNKYGKNFVNLYEINYKDKKTKKCEMCGKPCKNITCSSECSMKRNSKHNKK